MKPRFLKSVIGDLALAVGLPAVLIVLLLACAAESAPPMAAAPPAAAGAADGELWPAWTSTDPVTAVIPPDETWFIEKYGMTITFLDGSLRETAVFTFTPRPELKEPPVTTPYIFDLRGYFLSTGGTVSLWGDVRYDLQYEEAGLDGVLENTLKVYRFSDRWTPQDATVYPGANRIVWETNFTGKFGVGGLGPRTFVYIPTTFNSARVRATQARAQPGD
jgi:hypothetical protein